MGVSNIKFISVSDKLANEILQCSITLFNHFHETETEVAGALELNKKAKSIALGSVIKERINESAPRVKDTLTINPKELDIELLVTTCNSLHQSSNNFKN